jgi:predicted RNase H-like HicB family nuclease
MEFPELHFDVHEDESGGYWARCVVTDGGLYTQGDTLDELHANVIEVSLLYLEEMAEEMGIDLPEKPRFTLRFSEPVEKAA